MASYRFGPYLLNLDARFLLRGDGVVPLTPKEFDLLSLLVRRVGRVVSKDEILREVWTGDEVVEEWNLTQYVYMLRGVLGDSRKNPQYIETVPRRGYRFIAKVTDESPAPVTSAPQPSFRQLTFRRGAILRARFTSDGSMVVYGAAFEGAASEVFLLNLSGASPESRSLRLGDASLFSVSPAGELALALGERSLRGYVRSGTLARAPLFAGTTPRGLICDVQEAEWSPDSTSLAVVREVGGRSRLEHPVGNVLYETGGWVGQPRFSPGGEIAFIDHPLLNDDRGRVCLVGLDGKVRVISDGWVSVQGLAWSPGGDEVWFTAARTGNARSLWAASCGDVRLVQQMVGALTLKDVSRDGKILMTRQNTRVGIIGRAPGERHERDLSWLDWSLARDLSADGRTLLFTEAGEGGGSDYGVYVRGTDGSPAVRLGSGSALALSPNGQWALSRLPSDPSRLVLLPVGPGEAVRMGPSRLNYQQWACWFPDGRTILYTANEPGRGTRLFVQDVSGGTPQCLTEYEEGVYLTSPHSISPDGRSVAAVSSDDRIQVYGTDGSVRAVPGGAEPLAPVRWSLDGESVFVCGRGEVPARIRLLHLKTGELRPWMELAPPDPAGVTEFLRVLLTPDGESYAYTYTRDLSDLFVVEGLR